MKKRAMFIDYIFLLRPSIQAALWTFLFAGSYLFIGRTKAILPFSYEFTLNMEIGLIAYTLIMGSVYVLNQISDIDTDTINKKLFLLSEGIISKKNAYIFSAFCVVAGFSIIIFSGRFSVNSLLLYIVSYIMGILYTVKPFEFKRRPFIDLILNGIGYGMIAPLIGFELAGGKVDARAVIQTIPYILSMSAIFINTTLMDYKGDKEVGAVTTGVFLGMKKSLFLSALLMLVSCLSGLLLKDYIIGICACYSFFFFIYALVNTNKRNLDWSVKFTSPVMTLLLGILFPGFLLLSFIVLSMIFIYYKYRFNLKVI
jgi:4-hydroxybenzoate polyprenyltransferase